MKTINLVKKSPSLKELLELAAKDNVVLKTAEGRQFMLAQLDEFSQEVALVRRQKDLMKLLARRSKEKERIPLAEIKKELGMR